MTKPSRTYAIPWIYGFGLGKNYVPFHKEEERKSGKHEKVFTWKAEKNEAKEGEWSEHKTVELRLREKWEQASKGNQYFMCELFLA